MSLKFAKKIKEKIDLLRSSSADKEGY